MIKQTLTKLTILIVPCLLLLTACNYPSTYTAAPITPQDDTPSPFLPTATDTPDASPAYEGCAYVWASQELPELTKKLNNSLQAIDLNITASAYAYGENCVYADGRATFSAMETDYRIRVKVNDIKDEKALGDWIAKTMEVIIKIPPGDVAGPNPGRVEFSFLQGNDQIIVNAQIGQYTRNAASLRGVELFRFFHQNP